MLCFDVLATCLSRVSASVMSESGPHSAADSLLPIVQSQRERFRVRAQDLEAVSGDNKHVT